MIRYRNYTDRASRSTKHVALGTWGSEYHHASEGAQDSCGTSGHPGIVQQVRRGQLLLS